jgi:cyclophilin family peptidyl-prolyl cis-trans isomerase
MNKKWRDDVLKDDPVLETNAYGTVTYATSGADTRTTQLFINTNPRGNAFLDKQGFAPFGRIVEGMEYIERINNEYHEQPNQHKIETQGNAYLEKNFPRLSYIESLRCLDDDSPK